MSDDETRTSTAPPGPTLGQVGEEGVLDRVGQILGVRVPATQGAQVLVGPGDDTALLAVGSGSALVTTDAMVRGQDWRDDWSDGRDVGVKIVTQNLADLASMGGRGTGLVVTLAADPDTPLAWALAFTEGLADAAGEVGVPVIGGDLSSAPAGVVMVSVTAIGELAPGIGAPVLRSGARSGDVVALSGDWGRSGAGWALLERGVHVGPLVEHHRRPVVDLTQGPVAARHGARAMIDISDGLVRDADRVARASGVRIELDADAVTARTAALAAQLRTDLLDGGVPEQRAQQEADGIAASVVLSGGEEHVLLGCFPEQPPAGWTVVGRVHACGDGPGVVLDGRVLDPSSGGWDHFGG